MKSNWKQKNKPNQDGDHQVPQNENARALNSLQRALARRDHSVQELKTKLSRYYSESAVEYSLKEAAARRWLKSEKEIAEEAAQLYGRKLKSHTYIDQQMQKRGLPTPDLDFSREQDKISELIKKRFSKVDLTDHQQCMKAIRFLRYRGFDMRSIQAAFKNIKGISLNEVNLEDS